MQSKARALGLGLVDGALATGVMSAAMYGAQRAGLLGEMPPRKITRKLLRRGVSRRPSDSQLAVASALAHVGFGAASGGMYAVGARYLERAPRPLLGMLFATGIWAVSYWQIVPALNIMASPPKDRPGRPTTMLIAHWLFGATLGALFRMHERRRSARLEGIAQE